MLRWTMAAGIVLMLALSVAVAMEESPGEVKSKEDKSPKVYAPYSKLQDLSAEQKTQIAAAQAEAKEKIKQIEADMHAKIQALLTDDQKAVFKALEQAEKEKAKERTKAYLEKKKLEGGKAAEEAVEPKAE